VPNVQTNCKVSDGEDNFSFICSVLILFAAKMEFEELALHIQVTQFKSTSLLVYIFNFYKILV